MFNNIEWVFSGIGVVVLAAIARTVIKACSQKKSKNEIVPEGSSETVEISQQSIVSVYTLIPKFILKRNFKNPRVNSLVRIYVRPGKESVRLNLGGVPELQVWVRLVNHAPFDFEIESVTGTLNYNGCRMDIKLKNHMHVSKHSSIESIFLEGDLTGEQAKYCSKENNGSYTSLVFRARIKTRFEMFTVYSEDLSHIPVYIMNARKI